MNEYLKRNNVLENLRKKSPEELHDFLDMLKDAMKFAKGKSQKEIESGLEKMIEEDDRGREKFLKNLKARRKRGE